jgi:hypothetical protein
MSPAEERRRVFLQADRLLWVREKLEDAANELASDRPRAQERVAWAIYRMVAVVPNDLPVNLRVHLETIRSAITRVTWLGSEPGAVALPDADTERVATAILELRDEVRRRVDQEVRMGIGFGESGSTRRDDGRMMILLNVVDPSPLWRSKFLAAAQATAFRRALAVAVEGSAIIYTSSGDTRADMVELDAMLREAAEQ